MEKILKQTRPPLCIVTDDDFQFLELDNLFISPFCFATLPCIYVSLLYLMGCKSATFWPSMGSNLADL